MIKQIFYILILTTLVVSIKRNAKTDNWFRNLKTTLVKRTLDLPNVAVPRLELIPLPVAFNKFSNRNRGHLLPTGFERVSLDKPLGEGSHDFVLVSHDEVPTKSQSPTAQNPFKLYPQVQRKEYRCMNFTERVNFHTAIQKTKNTMNGLLSQYDGFVAQHESSKAPGAHFGPAFAPWHRHYLHQFENVMRSHCSHCALPFWDSRMESRLKGNPQDSVLFSHVLAGNPVGPVTTGFAANWEVAGSCKDIHPVIFRDFRDNVDYLYDDDDVLFAENVKTHEEMSMDWNENFELSHAYVHASFGRRSHMTDLLCSPVDPLFIMHHAFVDNLFERAKQSMEKKNPPLKYANVYNLPPGSDASIAINHAPNATMSPFSVKNSYGFFKKYEKYCTYDKSPGDVTKCVDDSDCCSNGYSRFLWCNTKSGLCASKVKEGGSVNSTYPDNACFCSSSTQKPIIRNGKCNCLWLRKKS